MLTTRSSNTKGFSLTHFFCFAEFPYLKYKNNAVCYCVEIVFTIPGSNVKTYFKWNIIILLNYWANEVPTSKVLLQSHVPLVLVFSVLIKSPNISIAIITRFLTFKKSNFFKILETYQIYNTMTIILMSKLQQLKWGILLF